MIITLYSVAKKYHSTSITNAFAPPYCSSVGALQVPSDAKLSTQGYDEGVPGLDFLYCHIKMNV